MSSHEKNDMPSDDTYPINGPSPPSILQKTPTQATKEPVAATKAPSSNPIHRSRAREVLFLAIICSSQLLTQAGLAQSIVPEHIIAASFGIENSPGVLSWFTAGYSLSVGSFILIAGRLGDVLGHKRLFVAGFAWYGLWSLLAGVAVYGGPVFFAVCRTMQGIGPALLLPNAIALITLTCEPGLRQNLILSLFGATAPGGFLLGAVFSSLLSQLAWWPWAYWVTCFACLLLAVLAAFVLPAPALPINEDHEGASIWQRVDVLGSVAGIASLVLFNFAWNQGAVVGWQTPYTYITLILGILVFVAFLFIEKRARYPLVPLGVLKIESFFMLGCITAGWSSFGIFVFYSLNFLEVQRGQTPLLTSAQFSPIAISGLCAALTTGLLLTRFRPSVVMLIAMLAFLVGGVVFATMPVEQTYWAQTFVGAVLLPWGMDMSFPAATIILSRAMSRQNQGLAASLVNTFVNYSISIGLGIAGTVDSQVNEGGKEALKGYRAAFYTGIGLAGLGVVVALVFCFVERQRSDVTAKPTEKGDEP